MKHLCWNPHKLSEFSILSPVNNFPCIKLLLLKIYQEIIVSEMLILNSHLFWQDLMAPISHNNTKQGCKTCKNCSFVSPKNNSSFLVNLKSFMNVNPKNNILLSEKITQKRLKILEYFDAYIRLIVMANTCNISKYSRIASIVCIGIKNTPSLFLAKSPP